MDKSKKRIVALYHRCPYCDVHMVRRRNKVSVLKCEKCGFKISDKTLNCLPMSMKEQTKNYLRLIKQLIFNIKSDYRTQKQILESSCKQKKKQRALKEIQKTEVWVSRSQLLFLMASAVNIDCSEFRDKVGDEIKNTQQKRWASFFD